MTSYCKIYVKTDDFQSQQKPSKPHLKKQSTLEKLYKITIDSWQLTGKKVLLVFGRRGDIKNPY